MLGYFMYCNLNQLESLLNPPGARSLCIRTWLQKMARPQMVQFDLKYGYLVVGLPLLHITLHQFSAAQWFYQLAKSNLAQRMWQVRRGILVGEIEQEAKMFLSVFLNRVNSKISQIRINLLQLPGCNTWDFKYLTFPRLICGMLFREYPGLELQGETVLGRRFFAVWNSANREVMCHFLSFL